MLIVTHRDLAQNDFSLHLRVGIRDERIEDHVGDSFHRGLETFLRGVDVIDRPVERRVSVGGAATAMNGVGELTVREATSSLEDHVLEIMRNPRAFPAPLMDAARADPGLNGAQPDTGTMGVDDLESVGKDPALRQGASNLGETQAFKIRHGLDVCPSLDGVQVRPDLSRANESPPSPTLTLKTKDGLGIPNLRPPT